MSFKDSGAALKGGARIQIYLKNKPRHAPTRHCKTKPKRYNTSKAFSFSVNAMLDKWFAHPEYQFITFYAFIPNPTNFDELLVTLVIVTNC
ncbi:MAG: hypothetical protein NZ529_04395 [Cytophagaceae bacterium]|nr:hypothetical protein [Cytophagaceae bacterium]MDW8456014.1 hypothetical protein [Cytophagaceae bacterium]